MHQYKDIADPESLNEAKAFLAQNKLPSRDLTIESNYFVGYYDQDNQLIGTGGLEFYSTFSLLRSIAVAADHRNKLLGRSILMHLVDKARQRGVTEIFLLTETATWFFEKYGFKKVDRSSVPEAVSKSSEFSTVCPASAVCMQMRLKHN